MQSLERDAQRAVLDLLDADAIVETARDLIAIPSLSAQETPAQRYVADFLASSGADVETWSIDVHELSTHPAFSAEFERDAPLGVVGAIGEDGPTLMLNAHVDVVPPGDGAKWTTPPFVPAVRDGTLYGRGACDTKGGLAAALHALRAIAESGARLSGRLMLSSVVGEEDGGSGTLASLLRGPQPDGCIVIEPTELTVAPAVAGALSFRVRVKGLAAHGALREEGVSAIEKLPLIQEALRDLERVRNRRHADPLFDWLRLPFAICAGRIAGGDWPSSEADWLTLEGRYGIAPGEDLDAARHELETAITTAGDEDPWLAQNPPTVEWWGGQFLPGSTAIGDRVVGCMTAAHEAVTGRKATIRGMPYGCDLGLTTTVGGIPSVVYGPGDIRHAHRPNERVPLEDLLACARALAVAALRFCEVVP